MALRGKTYVVDTGVVCAANGLATHMGTPDGQFQAKCAQYLNAIIDKGSAALDDPRGYAPKWGSIIFAEYHKKNRVRRRAAHGGEPGPGDMFVIWLADNQYVSERCARVPITIAGGEPGNIAEFPADAGLASFERADRAFVAVSLVCGKMGISAPVLVACDTDYLIHEGALNRAGVKREYVDEDAIRELHQNRTTLRHGRTRT